MTEANKNEPVEENEMTFIDHLEELRWRLLRSMIAIVAGMIICFIFAKPLLKILIYPASRLDPPLAFQFLKVQGMFIVFLEIGIFGGIILALPYILYQIWGFIAPGLLPQERRYVFPLLGFATLMFAIGLFFAYYILMPFALSFFVGLAPADITANIAIDFYIGFVIRLMLLFGIIFELPVVSYFLGKIGLLTSRFMRNYRRHAVVGIFVIAALLTPPDPITQILLGVPLILLYELSIFIVKLVEKKAKKEEEEQEQETLPAKDMEKTAEG